MLLYKKMLLMTFGTTLLKRKKEVKAIPLQAWGGLEGSRRLRLPVIQGKKPKYFNVPVSRLHKYKHDKIVFTYTRKLKLFFILTAETIKIKFKPNHGRSLISHFYLNHVITAKSK